MHSFKFAFKTIISCCLFFIFISLACLTKYDFVRRKIMLIAVGAHSKLTLLIILEKPYPVAKKTFWRMLESRKKINTKHCLTKQF